MSTPVPGGFDSHRVRVLGQDYPWTTTPVAGCVGPDGLTPGRIDTAAVTGRIAVLAVGSNASPAVLARKLGDRLDAGVPLLPVHVQGMVIAHSAHVSTGGYIPAAPALQQTMTEAVLTWYTPAQAALVDATEPNYRRRALPEQVRVHAPTTPGGAHGAGVCDPAALGQPVYVYDTVHGVLGDDDGLLTLRPQNQVLAWLNARLPGPDLSPADLLDGERRADLRTRMADLDLPRPSGLA